MKTFPANFNVNGQNFSFITIAPQFKVRPSAADVQSVIDFMRGTRWRIDASRIYVMGLSMGGGSTCGLVDRMMDKTQPRLFRYAAALLHQRLSHKSGQLKICRYGGCILPKMRLCLHHGEQTGLIG